MLPESKDAFGGPEIAAGVAEVHAILGDNGRAIEILDGLLSRPSAVTVQGLKVNPIWDPLRNDPRFQALLDKYGGESLSAALLFLVAAASTAHADWTIPSAQIGTGRAMASCIGMLFWKILKRMSSATVDLALFSTKSCTLRVIDQPTRATRSDLARRDAAEKDVSAGVNGGYFDPDYAPIGLLIVDGKTIAPLQRARLLTGVLTASSRGVQILRIREFSRQQKLNAAIQCGPFLVDLRRRVRGLRRLALGAENLRRGRRY